MHVVTDNYPRCSRKMFSIIYEEIYANVFEDLLDNVPDNSKVIFIKHYLKENAVET